MHRHALTNTQWKRLKKIIPRRSGPRSAQGDRNFVEAVLWIGKTGSPWRDLPSRFGSWKTIFNRFNDWSKTDKWGAIFAAVVEFDGEIIMLDGSVVRSHQDSCGGKGGSKKTTSVVQGVAGVQNSTSSSIESEDRFAFSFRQKMTMTSPSSTNS